MQQAPPMNAPTAGKQFVDCARDCGIRATCHTWLQLSCDTCTSSFSVSSEGSKLLAKGPSNALPTPSWNLIGQSHPGGGSFNVALSLGEMTASLAPPRSLLRHSHPSRARVSKTSERLALGH